MVAYLEKAKKLMGTFLKASIEVISQSKNTNADALAAGFNKGHEIDGHSVHGIPS